MSNTSCVVGCMIRSEPFTALHIKLQDGKFDHTGRLFCSVGAVWDCVNKTAGDYRELIPQFFCTPYFSKNYNKLDLGTRANCFTVNDVVLPEWAKGTYDFITKNRVALESSYGAYQNSIEHNNVYHFFSYHEV